MWYNSKICFIISSNIYNYLYTKLGNSGMYVWMESSGTSPPSALTGIGKGFGVIFGLAIVIGLLYLLKQAYVRNGPSPRPISWPTMSSVSDSVYSIFGNKIQITSYFS